MIKIGIIGYRNMGSMLVNIFISRGVLKEEEIIVSTRAKEKLKI
ncbi:MAG: NAD(P)-binding domain-containing protein [Candidatus Aenigmatarchaeota archaeon]